MDSARFIRENAPFLAAGALMTLISSFGQTFFISIFAGEIRAEYGLSHGTWGAIYSTGTLMSAVVMIWAGGLSDRFRARRLGAGVMTVLALACLAMALSRWVWMLPVIIFALRFAGQGMISHLSVVAMSRWFIAARGRALAIASLGYALGEAALPILGVALMQSFYWRHIWLAAAVVIVALIPVLSRLLRQERTPEASAGDVDAAGMRNIHWSRRAALGHWLFWAMVPSMLAPSTVVTALFFQQVHLSEVKGWGHATFVALVPVYTVVSVVSAIGFGWLIDRVGTGRLMPVYQLPLALGFAMMAYAGSVPAAGLAMGIMAISQGGQATLASAFWAEFYGTRHIGAIKAMAASIMVLGSAIGPVVSGILIDAGIPFDRQMPGIAAYIVAASVLVALAIARARRTMWMRPA